MLSQLIYLKWNACKAIATLGVPMSREHVTFSILNTHDRISVGRTKTSVRHTRIRSRPRFAPVIQRLNVLYTLSRPSRVHVTFSILDKHDKTLRKLLDFGFWV